jgi:hypothetical protein
MAVSCFTVFKASIVEFISSWTISIFPIASLACFNASCAALRSLPASKN